MGGAGSGNVNGPRTGIPAGGQSQPTRNGDRRDHAFQAPPSSEPHQVANVFKPLVTEQDLRRGAIQSQNTNFRMHLLSLLDILTAGALRLAISAILQKQYHARIALFLRGNRAERHANAARNLPMTLIPPHGGKLVNRVPEGAARDDWSSRAASLPHVMLNARQLADVELIAVGAFSPLE